VLVVVQEPDPVRAARQKIGAAEAEGVLDDVSQVLCEPTRRRIVEALSAAELPVGDLAAAVDRRVPAISQHLRVLRDLGIVEGERRASRVYYRLRSGATVERVQQLFDSVPGHPGAERSTGQRERHSGR
jgi:DNA-binding transcriptional ArsR family regulator